VSRYRYAVFFGAARREFGDIVAVCERTTIRDVDLSMSGITVRKGLPQCMPGSPHGLFLGLFLGPFRSAVYLAVGVVPWHTFNLIDPVKARDEKSHIYVGSERATRITIQRNSRRLAIAPGLRQAFVTATR
jgi:hypothetical protein